MSSSTNNSEATSNNKRIAKNTLFLYFRMILVMAVGLYTSRVVLQTLGVSDYGVYNVVGGIIGLLGYVNTLLAGGTSRFLTISLGENDMSKLKLTFSTLFVLTFFTSILILIVGETIGLWCVNHYLNVPAERIDALNWVYQCALISSALTIAQSPFTASIVSHEKMHIYAYMSIFDVVMKLLIVYVLIVFDFDKLKLYAILILLVNVLNILIYRVYCIRNFKECKFSVEFDRQIFKDQLKFSSWNMLGSLSAVCINYGINIVINIFFGTVVNAARGVASQVSNIVQQLYGNFQLAGRPQVMKYYAQKQYDEMFDLMCNNAKYCALLLICPIIPLFIYTEELLGLWLIEVPEYSTGFIRWALLYALFRSLDEPLSVAIHAVGKMMLPNMTCSIVNISILPISYIMYYYGGSPLWGAALLALFVPVCTCINFWILYKYIQFPWIQYIKRVCIPVLSILILSSIIPIVLYNSIELNILNTLICSFVSGINVLIIVFFFGIPRSLRLSLINKIKSVNPHIK